MEISKLEAQMDDMNDKIAEAKKGSIVNRFKGNVRNLIKNKKLNKEMGATAEEKEKTQKA